MSLEKHSYLLHCLEAITDKYITVHNKQSLFLTFYVSSVEKRGTACLQIFVPSCAKVFFGITLLGSTHLGSPN